MFDAPEDFGPLADICEKVRTGERLNFDDGMRLYQSRDLHGLGALAQIVRRRLNGRRAFFSVNLHMNYTNLCRDRCLFCSFARKRGAPDAYVIAPEDIQARVRRAMDQYQVNEVHIVGGHNPDLDFDYYLRMIRLVREASPGIYIKAFTAPEIDFFATHFKMPYREILSVFREAGLDGMPGGGAEIFMPETRRLICPGKIPAETWLEIHRLAHELGLKSNATMLYGHIETDEDRVDHVLRLRTLQDETNGFQSFIPVCYNASHNPMGKIGETGGFLDLKVFAVSRLLFDNIAHLKIHWVSTGLKMAQVALSFGVDDLGGTNLDENIIHDAGSQVPRDLRREDLERLIREAGCEPCLVDSSYQLSGK